jgi:glycerophosphoryl diester phosphodiesterase
MEIIAHRGASNDAPENTIAAFDLAWQQNADAVELDIRLTADGKIVCIHDLNTRRTAGCDKKVARQTLAELRALDAGRWKGKQWTGEKIPTLGEALAMLPDGKRLFIEVKCGLEVLPELERVIQQSGRSTDQIVLIGFRFATIVKVKQQLPGCEVCWLRGYRQGFRVGNRLAAVKRMIRKTHAARLDGLDLNCRWPINPRFVRTTRSAQLKLYVWTVDEIRRAEKLVAAGVDGIATNRPAWLREHLQVTR